MGHYFALKVIFYGSAFRPTAPQPAARWGEQTEIRHSRHRNYSQCNAAGRRPVGL